MGGGGGVVLIYLPCWPFSLLSFLLLLSKIRAGPCPSPRSATEISYENKREGLTKPDDNFRTYKINDRPGRFIVSLNFENK